MPESQLFRAYGAPAASDRIRNPGHRPTYSYGLARSISKSSLVQAWLILATVRDFHNKIVNKKGKRHVIYRKSYFIIQRLRSHGTPDCKNGGNTFAFLPEIQEEGKPKTLIRRMCRHLGSWQRRIIWKAGGSCALHYELLRCQRKPQGFCQRNHGR